MAMHPRLGFALSVLLGQQPWFGEHATLAKMRGEAVQELAQAQSLVHAVVDVVAQRGLAGEELAALTPVMPVVVDVIIDRLLASEDDMHSLCLFEALLATARVDTAVFEEFLLGIQGKVFLEQILATIASEDRLVQFLERLLDATEACPHSLKGFWDWSAIFQLPTHNAAEVRYFSFAIICKVFGSSGEHRHLAQRLNVDESQQSKLFQRRVLRHATLRAIQRRLLETTDIAVSSCGIRRVSTRVVDVCGVLLRAHSESALQPETHSSALVMTEITAANLQAFAYSIRRKRPVILQGPLGCGKSMLAHHVANSLGMDEVIELTIDDQTDSKTLLGSYVCSDMPGEFKFQPGVITQAVLQGRWVIIEDIDKLSVEVIAALATLLENRTLLVPQQSGEIVAHPNFRLIGTCTTDIAHTKLHNLRHFSSLFQFLAIQPLQEQDVTAVLTQGYLLQPVLIDYLLRAYHLFGSQGTFNRVAGYKAFSMRDLVKIARRVSKRDISGSHISQQQLLMVAADVIDVYAAGFRLRDQHWGQILAQLASVWGIPCETLMEYIDQRIPSLTTTATGFTVGRITMPCAREDREQRSTTSQSTFTFTGHATRLMERVAACAAGNEPILLVGETGCGKTTVIQELSKLCGRQLVVHNLSLGTDSTDLLGGFKPVDVTQLYRPLYLRFVELFASTFPQNKNAQYLQIVQNAYHGRQWKKLNTALLKASTFAMDNLAKFERNDTMQLDRWQEVHNQAARIGSNLEKIEKGFVFSFVEGTFVQAMVEGHWILLDEINLASPETLQRLTGVLEGRSIALTEKGDIEAIVRHPNFRIFAAMNPPTDTGKKELAPSLRSRFTELYVDELTDPVDLQQVVQQFVADTALPVSGIVDAYLACRAASRDVLVDSADQRPRYSLRTLTRTLVATKQFMNVGFAPSRALFEGFCMCFETQLEPNSRARLQDILTKYIGGNPKGSKGAPRRPGGKNDSDQWECIVPFWLQKGLMPAIDWAARDQSGLQQFVLTDAVETNIRNVARGCAAGVAPILLQGPTSAGKTTTVEYLAARLGHKCVRINNHEHTDVQEYIGSYVSDPSGRLVFKEGLLVQALRHGWWIILDELNLAPTDVLEALNRLLDDNRELFIAETGEYVRPHESFKLFAAQNPAGIYGGRKHLSQAFRNRFLEIHVDDIPPEEIKAILVARCGIAPSYSGMLVKVMEQLQVRRQESGIFEGKHSMITTRDLLKWANRKPSSPLEVATEGYMLLAERLRKEQHKVVIQQVLEQVCKVKLDVNLLYEPSPEAHATDNAPSHLGEASQLDELRSLVQAGEAKVEGVRGVAITKTLRRLWKLVGRCLEHQEPALLIGETGAGKTTVCQLYAAFLRKDIRILNCHHTTETADIIGGLRPVRGKEMIEQKVLEVSQRLVTKLLQEAAVDEGVAQSVLAQIEAGFTEITEIITIVRQLWSTVQTTEKSTAAAADAATSPKRRRADTDGETLDASELHELFESEAQQYNSLFQWQDGPLIESMRQGDVFVMDEISLAEDAVLERLNSVLEPGRTITLAEKGGAGNETTTAAPGFSFIATMNPGGDFGKRELSPALRSRFTEIWVPAVTDHEDLVMLLQEALHSPNGDLASFAEPMLEFIQHMNAICAAKAANIGALSIRDLLAWAYFLRELITEANDGDESTKYAMYVHGAFMILLDGLGLGTGVSRSLVDEIRGNGMQLLAHQCPEHVRSHVEQHIRSVDTTVVHNRGTFRVGAFEILLGPHEQHATDYVLTSPTTSANLKRVLRAMQVNKPILLEGPPGVGKTSLIETLAKVSGHRLVRINLSDQTDLSDLIGTDLPVPSETGVSTKFAWADGEFLRAIKNGDWVLLDELNLAPQSVLEGLNSCFDHRGEIFIPELGRTVHCPPSFRVFGAQNPLGQGGGRKGLPKSFLNRFTRVYVDALTSNDINLIMSTTYDRSTATSASIPRQVIADLAPQMVGFVMRLQEECLSQPSFGREGGPWEFNLRDLFRWCKSIEQVSAGAPADDVRKMLTELAFHLFVLRFRNIADREIVHTIFAEEFAVELSTNSSPFVGELDVLSVIGLATEMRGQAERNAGTNAPYAFWPRFLRRPFEACALGMVMRWPLLLVGPSGSGKTFLVDQLAAAHGATVARFAVSTSTDTTELLGCYEQVDMYRHVHEALQLAERATSLLAQTVLDGPADLAAKLFTLTRMTFQVEAAAHEVMRADTLKLEQGSHWIQQMQAWLEFACTVVTSDQLHADVQHVFQKLHRCMAKVVAMTQEESRGGFQWVDGVLVDAMLTGKWLMLDNVNLCSASVLDRLNAVLEPDGVLLLTECGSSEGAARRITAHPGFRIICTMDALNGEVSRAMRNRCLEIAIVPDSENDINVVAGQMLRLSPVVDLQLVQHVRSQGLSVRESAQLLDELAAIGRMQLHSPFVDASELCLSARDKDVRLLDAVACLLSAQLPGPSHAEFQLQPLALLLASCLEDDCVQFQTAWWQDGARATASHDVTCQISAELQATPNGVSDAIGSAGLAALHMSGQLDRSQGKLVQSANEAVAATATLVKSILNSSRAFVELEQLVSSLATHLKLERYPFAQMVLRASEDRSVAVSMQQLLIRLGADGAVAEHLVRLVHHVQHSVLRRLPLLLEERQAIKSDTGSATSIYQLCHACYDGRVAIDHIHMRVLSDFFQVLMNVDEVANLILETAEEASDSERAVVAMLRARDAFATLLLHHPVVSNDLHSLPWQRIFVGWEELATAAGQFAHHASEQSSECSGMLATISRTHDRLSEAWSSFAKFSSNLLWAAEHPPVPGTQESWHYWSTMMESMRLMTTPLRLSSLDGTSPALPSSLASHDWLLNQFNEHMRLLVSPSLQRSWVAAFLTLLLSKRDDLTIVSIPKQKNLQYIVGAVNQDVQQAVNEQLAKLQRLKNFSARIRDRALNEEGGAQVADDAAGHLSELVPFMEQLSKLSNVHEAGILLDREAALQLRAVIQDLTKLLLTLNSTVFATGVPSQDKLLRQCHTSLLALYDTLLANSFVEIEQMSPLQLTIWVVDCMLARKVSIEQLQEVIFVLSGALPWLESLLYTLDTFGSHNNLFSPATLTFSPYSLVADEGKSAGRSDGGMSRDLALLVGCTPALIPFSSIAVGRLLDTRAVCVGMQSLHTAQLQRGTAAWTISNFASKQSSLQALFTFLASAETPVADCLSAAAVVVQVFRLYHRFVDGSSDNASLSVALPILANLLSSSHKSALTVDELTLLEQAMLSIRHERLDALRSVLQSDLFGSLKLHAANREQVALYHASVALGVIRLQLSVPQSPVDPATRPGVQAALLRETRAALLRQAMAEGLVNLSAGGTAVSAGPKALLADAELLEGAAVRFDREAIERPDFAASFMQLYQRITDFMGRYGDANRVLALARSTVQLYSQLVAPGARSNVQHSEQLFTELSRKVDEHCAWRASVVSFTKQMEGEFSHFADILTPIHAAIGQLCHASSQLAGSTLMLAKNMVIFRQPNAENVISSSIIESLSFLSSNLHHPEHSLVQLLQRTEMLGAKLETGVAALQQFDQSWTLSPAMTRSRAMLSLYVLITAKCEQLLKGVAYEPAQLSGVLRSLWQMFMQKYLQEEDRKAQALADEAATYKYKAQTHAGTTDEERELKHRLEYFPEHLGDYDRILNPPIDGDQPEGVAEEAPSFEGELGEDVVKFLVGSFVRFALVKDSHMRVGSQDSVPSLSTRVESVHNTSALSTLCNQYMGTFLWQHIDPHLDLKLRLPALRALAASLRSADGTVHRDASQLSFMFNVRHDRLAAVDRDLLLLIDDQRVGEWHAHDFHNDPMVEEVLKTDPVLKSLFARTLSILQLFPDHEILLQIGRICERIAALPIYTPLGKLLASLGLLLRKCQEWEQYAAKHVSLSEEMAGLGRLIVDWRKRELQYWTHLLRAAEQRHAYRAWHLWFKLYGIFNSVPSGDVEHSSTQLDAAWLHSNETAKDTESTAASEFLRSFFDAVDTTLRTSTLGEFPTRLHLVRAFAADLLRENPNEAPIKRQLGMIAYNIWRYYEQFLSEVRRAEDAMRNPIHQKIQDHIKISKWDTLNYYALDAATDKAHATLLKFVRQYEEDALAVSVGTILRSSLHGEFLSPAGELIPIASIPSTSTLFPHALPEIKGIASLKSFTTELGGEHALDNQLGSISHPSIRKLLEEFDLGSEFKVFTLASHSEEMANAIFERIESLREEGTTRIMKLRAVVDLIKALRSEGISDLRQNVPEQFRDMLRCVLVELPDVSRTTADMAFASASPSTILEKAEVYAFRNMTELTQIRAQVTSTISKDVPLKDGRIMVAQCEQLVLQSLHVRAVLATQLQLHTKARRSWRQLHATVSGWCTTSHAIGLPASLANTTLTVVRTTVSALLDSLTEIKMLFDASEHSRNASVSVGAEIEKHYEQLSQHLTELIAVVEIQVSAPEMLATAALVVDAANAMQGLARKLSPGLSVGVVERICISIDGCAQRLQEPMQSIQMWISAMNGLTADENNSHSAAHSTVVRAVDSIAEHIRRSVAVTLHRQTETPVDANQDEEDASESLLSMRVDLSSQVHHFAFDQLAKLVDDAFQTFGNMVDEVYAQPSSASVSVNEIRSTAALLAQLNVALQKMLSVHGSLLEQIGSSHKSLSKLGYVVLRVYRTLLAKGVCEMNAQDEEGGSTEGMKFEDNVEGTGMGEGEGMKDVSDQIENEEQLMGLKDEDTTEKLDPQQSKQLNEEQRDQGIEMSQDFDGEIYDMPEDPQQKEDENGSQDDDDEEELDREMGNLGDDKDVVDQKEWDEGDGEDGDNKEEEEKFEKDSKMTGKALEDETRTKDDDEREGRDKDGDGKEDAEEDDAQDKPQKDETPDFGGDDEGPINEDNQENYEDHTGVDVREEEQGEENELGDLPEDMAFDGDDNGNGGEEEGEDDAQSMEGGDETKADDEADGEEEGDDARSDIEPEAASENEQQMDIPDEEFGNAASSGAQDQLPEDQNNIADEKEEVEMSDSAANKNAAPAYGLQNKKGKDAIQMDASQNEGDEEGDADALDEQHSARDAPDRSSNSNRNDTSQANNGRTSSERSMHDSNAESAPQQQQRSKEPPNPFKARGDISEHWFRHLNVQAREDQPSNEELEVGEETKQENPSESNPSQPFEHAYAGEQASEQVLGAVENEVDAAQIPDDHVEEQPAMDSDEATENQLPAVVDEADEPQQKRKRPFDELKNDEPLEKSIENQMKKLAMPLGNDDGEDTTDNAEQPEQDMQHETSPLFDMDRLNKDPTRSDFVQDAKGEESDEVDQEVALPAEELRMLWETKRVHEPEVAKELWERYKQATSSHAQRLCEQLRLVLEPTLASKLQGDYRSGKRINMKRVIGYIASGFRKDKIWMRRTKPAKRTYQVMLMIDDSKSMAEAGPLTLAAMTMISSALSRLEVGEVCVGRFAEGLDIVHDFNQPFTDESGSTILQNFTFDAEQTRLAASLETAAQVFSQAREHQIVSNTQLWQLLFIISDAKIDSDNRVRLGRFVRELFEQQVLVVLLIIDRPTNAKDSIFNTKVVDYTPNGIKMRSYFHGFPFPYYVTIQEMETLPEILADSLRQWFELTRTQGNA